MEYSVSQNAILQDPHPGWITFKWKQKLIILSLVSLFVSSQGHQNSKKGWLSPSSHSNTIIQLNLTFEMSCLYYVLWGMKWKWLHLNQWPCGWHSIYSVPFICGSNSVYVWNFTKMTFTSHRWHLITAPKILGKGNLLSETVSYQRRNRVQHLVPWVLAMKLQINKQINEWMNE